MISRHANAIVGVGVVILATIADKAGYHAIAMVMLGLLAGSFAVRLDEHP